MLYLTCANPIDDQDLFAQKIARIPLQKFFPEFTGAEGDAAAAKKFILNVSVTFSRHKRHKLC